MTEMSFEEHNRAVGMSECYGGNTGLSRKGDNTGKIIFIVLKI